MKHNSKTIIVFAGIFVVLAIVLYGCGGGGGGGGYGGGGTPPSSTVQVVACPASGTIDVNIVSMTAPGFSPSSSTVPVNTIVKWTNIDGILHTVTSTTVPLNGTFDMQVNPSTSVCLKFTSAGTFNYHCSIHPTTMIGVVTVQ
jgi:plastocyanin